MSKPSDFAAFADLAEITNATDEQLASMLVHGCSDLPIANFEDAMMEVLARFTRHLTGIPWVRAYQQGGRPGLKETGIKDGQYGVLWLLTASPYGSSRMEMADSIDPLTGLPRGDLCEVIRQPMRYRFQIDVYRDSGEPNRQQDNDVIQQPVQSAFDVLLSLSIKMKHRRARAALGEQCISYGEHPVTGLSNLPQPLVSNSFETRATAALEVFAAPISAMRMPAFGEVDLIMSCSGQDGEPQQLGIT